jgi:GR25 family glycosyltransferase involved in LPS biosynthesis
MKIYVINLSHRLDRKQFMLDQFKKYSITDYEFVEAVNGSTLDISLTGYDDLRAKNIFRAMSNREIACALSHVLVYKKIISSGQRGIILEDDCVLSEVINDFVNVDIPESVDLVMLGHRSSNREDNLSKPKSFNYELISRQPGPDGRLTRTYFNNEKITLDSFDLHKINEQSYKVDFLFSAHGYSPSLNMCKILAGFNNKPKVPADVIWNILHEYGFHVDIWGVIEPICTIEVDNSLGSDIDVDRESVIVNTYMSGEIAYMQRVLSSEYDT